ncbi:MAG: ketoacid CoA transferase [Pseudomonadales bacterium]|uniref:CoA-transferase subunit beta n=1 Tax=unclassified Ketobacter TaxID=2639109 RepID=UPI000C4EC435|nr:MULTISPECIES: ketoacid CoA transferase [unclassified Ketobacter]MAQ26015.1 ketoacid CoA transferase [Pseudomonadales bacterium]HAG97202.1 ketoacid CoA transferase [Gammaproteobacteria bacterium]MBI25546.1 ketoacid CoA transferase [Pseudomonadales bacterium]RLT89439.1 MAG: ketoacid CoA transferase [Ketobacter sp. GenoA1]RLT95946.1 MAG: ketoacid CoA transferase [Ketobacter sp.]
MNQTVQDYSLAELMIAAAADAFRGDGEVLATGIGLLPRLAASLAMKTCNPDMMMTDSEAYLLSEPNPVSGRKSHAGQAQETWMGFSRIFDNVWSGKRHAMVGPSQIDRYGQTNISALGGTYQQPKVQMLGARGFPGNSISHANSFFVPAHSKRVFVEDECDVVCSVGYNPQRLPRGYTLDDIDIRLVITDLCVMDWNGPQHMLQLISLHPGISVEQVLDNTGFEVQVPAQVPTTAAPTPLQMEIIGQMDPLNLRARQLKDNPPGDRR